MTIHRLSRIFALGNFALAAGVLLAMVIVLQSPETSFAQTTGTTAQKSGCVAPSFYSFNVPPAVLNSPWTLPLLSTLDGTYAPTVTATGLAPGIELQDQKSTIAAGGASLHIWVLTGTPSQLGTYTITVTAQNSCGGSSAVVTLPVNNSTAATGSACPSGTTGTYPNCATVPTNTAFDKTSLVTSTSSPTITGTSNTAKVSLEVKNTVGNVYTSPLVSVLNGRWAIPLTNISTGTYSLSLYGENNLLLILGTLIAAIPSTSGSVPQITSPVSSTAAPSVTACADLPTATMQIGGRGTGVTNLQNFLIQKGLLPEGSATGYFGPLTRAAVQQFQSSAGIVSSGDEKTTGFGLVGARTRSLIACQGTAPTNSAQQPTQRISCPLVPQPVCGVGGTLIPLGFDNNGCSLGKVCQMPVGQTQNISCPVVKNPSCQYGTLISLGTDYDGCSLGSYCQPAQCSYIQQITSCPAGQTLVSGTDQYGCPNVSYCSGGSSATSSVPVPGTTCLQSAYQVANCPAGYHSSSINDLNGCPMAPLCVPN
ncbi:peptidoglycan-binding protein [Patescibacteria group bacterium]|nr:peptidoglycan-binding protein [Patescibacteria group bacterium]